MKALFVLLALATSLSTFAQERVELLSEKVSVSSDAAIVVRTNKTPETVVITFKVPMANSVCERYETRYVVRQSSTYCGEDVRYNRVRVRRCVQTDPNNGRCVRYHEEWRDERISIPRTCPVPETYCAQYGTAVTRENDEMKIRFKNLPSLGDSESETFEIKARQKTSDGENVIYDVKPVETLREYKVSQKKILGFKLDSYVVEEK